MHQLGPRLRLTERYLTWCPRGETSQSISLLTPTESRTLFRSNWEELEPLTAAEISFKEEAVNNLATLRLRGYLCKLTTDNINITFNKHY
jgi:hypothetical protein